MNTKKMVIPDRNVKIKIQPGKGGLRRRAYRVRAEDALGRALKHTEEVHHHTPTQLVICQDHAYHGLLHARMRIVRAGGDPDTQAICGGECRRLLPRTAFSPNRGAHDGRNNRCKECERQRKRSPEYSRTLANGDRHYVDIRY